MASACHQTGGSDRDRLDVGASPSDRGRPYDGRDGVPAADRGEQDFTRTPRQEGACLPEVILIGVASAGHDLRRSAHLIREQLPQVKVLILSLYTQLRQLPACQVVVPPPKSSGTSDLDHFPPTVFYHKKSRPSLGGSVNRNNLTER
jgi:hypothetical protein